MNRHRQKYLMDFPSYKKHIYQTQLTKDFGFPEVRSKNK